MGYCIHQTGCKIRIPSDKLKLALLALATLALGPVQSAYGRYSWVDVPTLQRATTLQEHLREWRWEPTFDAASGDLVKLRFDGEKLGDCIVMLKALAPYVDAGSFIDMSGEDGETWRWYFDGVTCTELTPKVTYATPSDVVDVQAREVRPAPRLAGPMLRLK